MKIELSSGAIIFKEEGRIREYLILNYGAGHWDFAKGHVEEGEGPEDTAIREIEEETGIERLEFYPEFKENIDYTFRTRKYTVYKEVIFYLAKTDTKTVTLSFEHQGYEWLKYDDAIEKLTYKNAKQLLEKAENFLKKEPG